MAGKVIPMPKREPPEPTGVRAFPEHWTERQRRSLMVMARRYAFTLEELVFGIGQVKSWYEGDPRKRKRADWVAVIRNGMNAGWAVRGFRAACKRGYHLTVYPQLGGRRQSDSLRPITDELIEQVMEAARARTVAEAEDEGRERE